MGGTNMTGKRILSVLIACESSGHVRQAFRDLGHDAWSCDLLPPDDQSPFHYQADCFDIISMGWDIIIMHPPCTALCVSGNRWYGKGMPKYNDRLSSIQWTSDLWNHACLSARLGVAMENPVGVIPMPPSQYIQPWQFGHGETKRTGLWLKNLLPLQPTHLVSGREARIHKLPPSSDRWKIRSQTFPGIAQAMAMQWSTNIQIPLFGYTNAH
jgi:hypothetical protein